MAEILDLTKNVLDADDLNLIADNIEVLSADIETPDDVLDTLYLATLKNISAAKKVINVGGRLTTNTISLIATKATGYPNNGFVEIDGQQFDIANTGKPTRIALFYKKDDVWVEIDRSSLVTVTDDDNYFGTILPSGSDNIIGTDSSDVHTKITYTDENMVINLSYMYNGLNQHVLIQPNVGIYADETSLNEHKLNIFDSSSSILPPNIITHDSDTKSIIIDKTIKINSIRGYLGTLSVSTSDDIGSELSIYGIHRIRPTIGKILGIPINDSKFFGLGTYDNNVSHIRSADTVLELALDSVDGFTLTSRKDGVGTVLYPTAYGSHSYLEYEYHKLLGRPDSSTVNFMDMVEKAKSFDEWISETRLTVPLTPINDNSVVSLSYVNQLDIVDDIDNVTEYRGNTVETMECDFHAMEVNGVAPTFFTTDGTGYTWTIKDVSNGNTALAITHNINNGVNSVNGDEYRQLKPYFNGDTDYLLPHRFHYMRTKTNDGIADISIYENIPIHTFIDDYDNTHTIMLNGYYVFNSNNELTKHIPYKVYDYMCSAYYIVILVDNELRLIYKETPWYATQTIHVNAINVKQIVLSKYLFGYLLTSGYVETFSLSSGNTMYTEDNVDMVSAPYDDDDLYVSKFGVDGYTHIQDGSTLSDLPHQSGAYMLGNSGFVFINIIDDTLGGHRLDPYGNITTYTLNSGIPYYNSKNRMADNSLVSYPKIADDISTVFARKENFGVIDVTVKLNGDITILNSGDVTIALPSLGQIGAGSSIELNVNETLYTK